MAKTTKTWIEESETAAKALAAMVPKLRKLADRAPALREASRPAAGAGDGARWEARDKMRDIRTQAEIIGNVAEQIAAAVSDESPRERAEKRLDAADAVLRADSFQDVRDVAEEYLTQWRNGEFSDRDSALEWLHETVDGHQNVIYTARNFTVLRYSDNDGAYAEEFGTDGLVRDGGINWAAMAFAAMEADVRDRIGAEDFDALNDEPPQAVKVGDEVTIKETGEEGTVRELRTREDGIKEARVEVAPEDEGGEASETWVEFMGLEA